MRFIIVRDYFEKDAEGQIVIHHKGKMLDVDDFRKAKSQLLQGNIDFAVRSVEDLRYHEDEFQGAFGDEGSRQKNDDIVDLRYVENIFRSRTESLSETLNAEIDRKGCQIPAIALHKFRLKGSHIKEGERLSLSPIAAFDLAAMGRVQLDCTLEKLLEIRDYLQGLKVNEKSNPSPEFRARNLEWINRQIKKMKEPDPEEEV